MKTGNYNGIHSIYANCDPDLISIQGSARTRAQPETIIRDDRSMKIVFGRDKAEKIRTFLATIYHLRIGVVVDWRYSI